MASGAIRPTDQTDALNVELSIDSFEIDLRSGREELGNWLTSTVTIRRIDEHSFEFIAEGDRLIFMPEDPDAFGEHPAVSDPAQMKRRERRRARKDAKYQAKRDAKEAALQAKEAEREAKKTEKAAKKGAKRSTRGDAAGKQPEAQLPPAMDVPWTDAPPASSLADRTAAIKAGTARIAPEPEPELEYEPVVDHEPAPIPSIVVADDEPEDEAPAPGGTRRGFRRRRRRTDEQSELTSDAEIAGESEPVLEPAATVEDNDSLEDGEGLPAETRRRITLRRRRTEEEPEPIEGESDESDEPDEPDDELNRMWIRAIDVARRYDLLGLDRVPIDESLRGQEHQHTWDHRVAWKTGPGSRICTICGKVRREESGVS